MKKMTPKEMALVAMYRTARVGGMTREEAEGMWDTYPVTNADPDFVLGGYEGLDYDSALKKVDEEISKSPYYNAHSDKIEPPRDSELVREYH